MIQMCAYTETAGIHWNQTEKSMRTCSVYPSSNLEGELLDLAPKKGCKLTRKMSPERMHSSW